MSGGTFSLRRRLAAMLTAGVLALWLVATGLSWVLVRHELNEAYDESLAQAAHRLLALGAAGPAGREPTTVGAGEGLLTYRVRDAAGRVVLSSRNARDTGFPAPSRPGFVTTASHRVFTERDADTGLLIQVAEPLAHRREAAMETTLSLLLPLPLLVPLSLLGVWWVVRRTTAPVLSLRGEIERRAPGDLAPLTANGLPAEIRPLADAVNRLMARLRDALAAERSFTANSAHELRTPIAGALGHTQRLLADTDDPAVHERARHIEAGLRHLARVSEKLMQLARAEAGVFAADTPQPLDDVLTLVVDEFRRPAGSGDRVTLTVPDGVQLAGALDPDGFAILLRNLIENALCHSPADSPVAVVVDGARRLRVINDSPVIPAATLRQLHARFRRGATGPGGTGLGLAIVEAIAEGAGVSVTLNSPATGRTDGVEAAVILPDGPRPA
ncbi:Sensor protein QseC [wastewater metagenome]|uniref:histidine kinase n=2 Tax=unclassified sequences TaxID=12908 RepID=A0A5B8RE42_9ZZZZ|nr:ATP-binding protein [Arhodomonas sp. KWT]QEA07130.1 sensor protein QseC [uncultured organism]